MRTIAFIRSFPFSSAVDQRSLAIGGVAYTLPRQGPPRGGPVTNPLKAPSDTRSVVAMRNRPGAGIGSPGTRRRWLLWLISVVICRPLAATRVCGVKGQPIWRFLDGLTGSTDLKRESRIACQHRWRWLRGDGDRQPAYHDRSGCTSPAGHTHLVQHLTQS